MIIESLVKEYDIYTLNIYLLTKVYIAFYFVTFGSCIHSKN